jgi:type IV fimbrial biogenesis protein FimT
MAFRSRSGGFSLIEIMVVLAIAGILISIGVTAYDRWAQRQSVRGGARDLALALQSAKGFAVQRGHNALVLFNSPANGSYQIVDDLNNNCVADGGEALLYQNSLPVGVTLPACPSAIAGPPGLELSRSR